MLEFGGLTIDESELAALFRCYSTHELSLFGSAVTGKMRPDSNIDLLVEFLPSASIDLVDSANLMAELSRFLGSKVDLVSKKGLKPRIRAGVLEEARLLYAS